MGVYSTTRLISKDMVIRPRSPRRKRTAPSPVIHAQGRPYACPLLRVSYHPYAHSSTVSPHLAMSISRRDLHTHRFLPLPRPFVPQPIRAMLRCAHAANTWRRVHGRGSGPTSRVRGHVFHSMAPHVSTTCIYSLSTCPALVLSACSTAAPLAILLARLAYLTGSGCVAA
jgi:hypothetical protein